MRKGTPSAATALLCDIKKAGRLVLAGIASLVREFPRPGSPRETDQTEDREIIENLIPSEDRIYLGSMAEVTTAEIPLVSNDLPVEDPYDTSWLANYVRFIDRTDCQEGD